MRLTIPVEAILKGSRSAPPPQAGNAIGTSREGREIVGYPIGHGPRRVSLIAGCHADEPVGPAMLDRLAAYLSALPDDAPLVSRISWFVVPHVNPDGEARNVAWTQERGAWTQEGGSPGAYDLGRYLRHAVREPPGDDLEFGFPRGAADTTVRPESRAVAAFLRTGAPFALHASFHGMAFAAGPWFLMERSWIDCTLEMRDNLRARVKALGYRLHDIDRGGEKGFHRIDEGFTTRPDSRAMAAHFEARDEEGTAKLFRPSSMEFVRSLGGDPLTLVSEMPLFLLPAEHFPPQNPARPHAVTELRAIAESDEPNRLAQAAQRLGVRAMPIADQMQLQLAYLEEGLAATEA
ncbi:MAG: peptidase [bacterium]|nr:peptidase [bacterium]